MHFIRRVKRIDKKDPELYLLYIYVVRDCSDSDLKQIKYITGRLLLLIMCVPHRMNSPNQYANSRHAVVA